jgi:hypothetical protein
MSAVSSSTSSSYTRRSGGGPVPGHDDRGRLGNKSSYEENGTTELTLDSEPIEEIHDTTISRDTSPATDSSAAGLEDSGGTYVLNMIRYLKTVWPLREGKRKKNKMVEHDMFSKKYRSTRVLELQLKLHQERFRYD